MNNDFLATADDAIAADPIIENICFCNHPRIEHKHDMDGHVTYCLSCECRGYDQATGWVW